jgi:biotin carboxylase
MRHNSLNEKTLLVVDTGPLKKKFIFQRLKKMGVKLVVMNQERNWAAPFVDHWIVTDNYNHREAITGLQHFLKQHPKVKIDGVITFWEDHVLLVSKIVDKFNLIGIPHAIAKNVRNKFRFREFCAENGLKTPRHRLISSVRDLAAACKQLSFPLVIKPAYGADSVFVVKVNDREELYETFEYIQNTINADNEETSSLADGMEIFVEEYIDGDEVDIDIILQNGKIKFYSIADNFNKNRDQFFVDSGQAIPSGLPAPDRQALIDMAEEVLEKLGIQNACIHFEAKSTADGPVPIEINLRMGGDYVYSYIKGAWGVDLIEEAAKVALGMYTKIEKPEEPLKYIVGWDLHPESSGVLVELDIPEELSRKKYLEEISVYKEVGDPVLLPPVGYELLGWLTVSGDNILDAQDNLKEALKLITYKVVAFDDESSIGQTTRRDKFSVAVLNKNLVRERVQIEKVRRAARENLRELEIVLVADPGDQAVATPAAHELRRRGYRVTTLDTGSLARLIADLRFRRAGIALAMAKSIEGNRNFEPHVMSLLELFNMVSIGTSSLNLMLHRDKIRLKKLLAYHHIPIPAWDYVRTPEETISDALSYPALIKPAHSSDIPLSKESLVKTKEAAEKIIPSLLPIWKAPAVIEEYIPGDEYHVFILGTDKTNWKVLPLVKIMFATKNGLRWYRNDKHTVMQCPPKNMSPKLESLITEIALDAYRVMRFRDFGEIRIRVDKDDNPHVISCNATPDIYPGSLMIKAAERMGMKYGDVLEELIGLGVERYKNTSVAQDYL